MSVGLSSSGLSQNDVGGKLKNCAGIMQSKVSFHARFYNMPPISVGMVTRNEPIFRMLVSTAEKKER